MKISFNPNIIDKPVPFPTQYAHTFEPFDHTLDQVIEKVRAGQALCTLFEQTRRKENFKEAGFACLDFDGKAVLLEIKEHPFVKQYAGFIYTTPSHGKEGKGDRFRIIFPLENPITDIKEYESLLASLLRIFPNADQQCKDATRLYYGNTNADIIKLDKQLDDLTLSALIAGALTAVEKSLTPLGEGERDATLISIAGSLRHSGFEQEEIHEWLQRVNIAQCDPPLPDRDITKIARSAAKYPEGENGKPSPNKVAEEIIANNTIITDQFGNPYEYDGSVWKPLGDAKLLNMALNAEPKYLSRQSRRNEIINYIKAATFHGNIEWRQLKPWQVPFQNGVFDLLEERLLPHCPEYYLETVLPHDYVVAAEAPRWQGCLQEWLEDEPAKIEALQMFFGYILMPHARYKKALLGYGESNTGKSQVAKVMEAMVGTHNICSIALNQMGSSRNLAPIKGKMLNLVTELPEFHRLAEGGFKQLVSTEDPIQLDAKYMKPEMYVPFCKHVVFTNTLPQIRDLSDAVFNRLLVIEFNRIVPDEKQDKNLFDRLKSEMPGIIHWAIQGAVLLHNAEGQFIEPDSSKELLDEYRLKQNPVHDWAEHRLNHAPGAISKFEALWADFHQYYKGKDINRDRFSKLFKKAGFDTERNRVNGITSTFIRDYTLVAEIY